MRSALEQKYRHAMHNYLKRRINSQVLILRTTCSPRAHLCAPDNAQTSATN